MEPVEGTQKRPAPSLLCTRGGTYSVQTPYGYQLDLDFLKYVEEIESGCKGWAPRRPQCRPPQRGPRTSPRWGRVEQALMEVSQRLQLARLARSDSLAELGEPDIPHVSPSNSSDPEFCQSHASSPLSPTYSPACSDDPASSQDSGVGPDLAELGKGGQRGEAGRLGRDWWSVAVGDDRPLEESRDLRDVAVATELVETCEIGVGTDEASSVPKGQTERELDALRHTVEIQRQRIQDLEAQLSLAQQQQETRRPEQEQEALKPQQEQDKSQTGGGKVCTKALMHKTQVETEPCPGCTWASSHLELPEDTGGCKVQGFLGQGAGSTQSATLQQNDQSTQTDFTGSLRENASLTVTSRGSQWESPDEDKDKSIIPAVQNGEVMPSKPAAGMPKSIMKRPGEDRASRLSAGHRKCLQFVGILKGGYESTSSEEEEDEEEGSFSGASDSSGGAEESLEDSSFQERNINPDSGNEPEIEEEKEKFELSAKWASLCPRFELSAKMREACLILKSHLDDDISAVHGDVVLSSSHTVELEWFRVSSSKTARPAHVTSFLVAFSQLFPGLVECVVNMADLNGNTALHYSLSYSNFAVVRVLLDTGVCCVDQWNKAGYTPVMLAAVATMRTADNMQLIRRLFSQGNVNAKAKQTGQTALMLAVARRRMEMVWALLDSGADVNAQDGEGRTALMSACQHGHAHTVSLLLQHPRCDITLRNNAGDTALSIALGASRSDIAVLLYTHMNRSIPPPTPTALSSTSMRSTPSTTESETTKAISGRPPLPKKMGIQRRHEAAKTEKLKGRSTLPANSQTV
ncbi:hypothetical protein ANANG_G00132790 [Anguilla anguilla]|uniref:Uncharacterized protein n=1 Tax=Anguilla anguilla TaxID=7936 RepID=A0A9D3MFK5_ANGAN|nr:hypothetical protein ANANG_G00132790 [Anguilla anguilla]